MATLLRIWKRKPPGNKEGSHGGQVPLDALAYEMHSNDFLQVRQTGTMVLKAGYLQPLF